MALISTLSDNFDDNSLDGAKWDTTLTDGVVSEANQQIEITSGTAEETTLYSVDVYDLTASQSSIEIIDNGDLSYCDYIIPLSLEFYDGVDWSNVAIVLWTWEGTEYVEVFYWDSVAGENIQIDVFEYNATTHKYFRIREDSGLVYIDYSANGTSWTNVGSVASSKFALDYTTVVMKVVTIYSGPYGSTMTMKVDNFNVLPSASTTGIMTTRSNYWGDI